MFLTKGITCMNKTTHLNSPFNLHILYTCMYRNINCLSKYKCSNALSTHLISPFILILGTVNTYMTITIIILIYCPIKPYL